LTLPETVIAALEAVDRDLSRAVVRVTQPALSRRPRASAELAMFGRRAVIVVNPTRTLEKRTGVLLVPLSDGRALMAFDEMTTPARLELKIQDELDRRDLPAKDAQIFSEIQQLLQKARRSESTEFSQRNIIVLEYGRNNQTKRRQRVRQQETIR
jgi:hypothetical protein